MAQSKTDGIHNYFSKNAVAINQEDLTADALMSSEYNIPLTFTEKRHIEKIIGTQKPSGAWRMKERVSDSYDSDAVISTKISLRPKYMGCQNFVYMLQMALCH